MLGDISDGLNLASLRNFIEEAEESSVSIYDELKSIDVRYLAGEPFNQGGMKHILRTRDALTGRPIAMATLRDLSRPEAVENFLREARITAHLEHPNIVPIYDIGLDEEMNPYFTMKLLSGENLGRILRRIRNKEPEALRDYPLTERLDLFLKLCDAIAYAHGSGVIHLDLKPENIQINVYGEVLVCDWGLAKITNSDCASERSILDDSSLYASCVNYLTIDGFLSGTPGYMAPEQAAGRKQPKTEQTDIYSLGCILYSLLTLECPMEGTDVDQILLDTREGRFEPPRKRTPRLSIPASLEAVVLKAMALDPDQRYRSVENMVKDIQAYRNGFATRAEDAGFWTQLKLLLKRNPKVAWTMLVTSMLLGLVITFYTYALKQREQQSRGNLDLYKTEREWRENYEAAPDYYYEAFELYQQDDLDRAGQKVRIALDYDKRLFRAWELKAMIHFAKLEFGEAAISFRRTETRTATTWENMSTKLQTLPRNSKGAYSPQTFRTMMRIIGRQRKVPHVRQMLKYYVTSSEMAPKERMQLIREIWSGDLALNEISLKLKAVDGPDGWSIDLSGTKPMVDLNLLEGMPIHSFTYRGGNLSINELGYLSVLPIRLLDLSDCKGFSHIDPLFKMSLDELHLRGTQITRINAVSRMDLKVLDISKIPKVNASWLQFLASNCTIDRLRVSERVSQFGLQIERLSVKTVIEFLP